MNRARRIPALDESTLSLAYRGVWLICIGVYLTVFVSGIHAGAAELITIARAAAFALAAAVLGRLALNLLERASLPAEQGPTARQPGTLGSLDDLASSTNVAQQIDEAEAA